MDSHRTAVEELHSHLKPDQFGYLMSVLSASNNSNVSDASYVSVSAQALASSSTTDMYGQKAKMQNSSSNSSTDFVTSMMAINKNKENDFIMYKLQSKRNPTTAKQSIMQKLRPPSFPKRHSLESKHSANCTPLVRSRRESTFAVCSEISPNDVVENLTLAETKYSQVPIPVVTFQGNVVARNESFKSTAPAMKNSPCSELPVCKKIMGKYILPSLSRSSSTESVYAESLPDPDNPLLNIAGKIANEPVNPFPVLRMPPKKLDRRGHEMKTTNFTDTSRIEKDIDRELRKFQNFRNVSEFFTKRNSAELERRKRSNKSAATNFSRRVTNPLYKEYNPNGYQKSEEELASECIQTICNDFNAWIQSLAEKSNQKDTSENIKATRERESIEIGPEFLVKILRTDLELPAEE